MMFEIMVLHSDEFILMELDLISVRVIEVSPLPIPMFLIIPELPLVNPMPFVIYSSYPVFKILMELSLIQDIHVPGHYTFNSISLFLILHIFSFVLVISSLVLPISDSLTLFIVPYKYFSVFINHRSFSVLLVVFEFTFEYIAICVNQSAFSMP